MDIKSKVYNLLRWSETHTQTDMVYVAKGGFWLVIGQIVSVSSALVLSIIFANLLPKESYGIYKYALSLVGILTALTLTGMNAAVTQAVARGFEGTLKKSFWIQLRWGIIVFFAATAGSLYYFIQGNSSLALIFIFIALTLPISTSANTYTAFLGGKKEFKKATQYYTISIIIHCTIILITLLLTKNPLWLVLAYLISTTGTSIFFYIRSIKELRPNEKNDQESISYGKHLSLVIFFGIIASYLDNILIFHYLGSASLAIYSFASAPADQFKGLFKNIPNLVIPKIASRSLMDTNRILNQRFIQLILSGIITAIIYIFIVPYFFKIFFPKYLDAIWFARLFGISIALMPINALLSAISNGKLVDIPKRWLYQLNFSIQIITIGSLLFLTPLFGITGAILSKIVASLTTMIILLYYWKKILRINAPPQN